MTAPVNYLGNINSKKQKKQKRVKILYIGGYGRSGSTLIAQLLSNIPTITSPGEIRHIWTRSFLEDQLCGCGAKFEKCEFWSKVKQGAFPKGLNIQRILFLKSKVDRARYIPSLYFGHTSRTFDEYANYLEALYFSIAQTSQCNVIVDASKDPSYAYVLANIKAFDVYILHLVRDSRAVAYSWQRKRIRPEIHWESQTMPVISPYRSTLDWIFSNVTIGKLRNQFPYFFLRYEDFSENPIDYLNQIMTFINVEHVFDKNTFSIGINHSIAGNPMRFTQGDIIIKQDDSWKIRANKLYNNFVTVLSWPLLLKYKYSIFRYS